MKTKYFFLAAIGALTLASCSNDEFIGDNSPTLGQEGDGSIQFSYKGHACDSCEDKILSFHNIKFLKS